MALLLPTRPITSTRKAGRSPPGKRPSISGITRCGTICFGEVGLQPERYGRPIACFGPQVCFRCVCNPTSMSGTIRLRRERYGIHPSTPGACSPHAGIGAVTALFALASAAAIAHACIAFGTGQLAHRAHRARMASPPEHLRVHEPSGSDPRPVNPTADNDGGSDLDRSRHASPWPPSHAGLMRATLIAQLQRARDACWKTPQRLLRARLQGADEHRHDRVRRCARTHGAPGGTGALRPCGRS